MRDLRRPRNSTRSRRAPSSCSATSTTRCSATSAPRSAIRATSISTTARRGSSTSSRLRTTADGGRSGRSRRCQQGARDRRPTGRGVLPARAVPTATSSAETTRCAALADRRRSCRRRCCTRARSSPISTAGLGRVDDRICTARGAARPRSRSVARGGARPGLRARRPVRSRRDDARPRRRALPRRSVRLCRARARLARDRPGAHDRVALSKALDALEGAVGTTTAAKR